MIEERSALILRGEDEAQVVKRANELLEAGDYELALKPVAVKGVIGAGRLMMIVLERPNAQS